MLTFNSGNASQLYESESSFRNNGQNNGLSIYDEQEQVSSVGRFLHGVNNNNNNNVNTNLSATITSIQTNATRVLNMYFENATIDHDNSLKDDDDDYDIDVDIGVSESLQNHIQKQAFFVGSVTSSASVSASLPPSSPPPTNATTIFRHQFANILNFVTKSATAETANFKNRSSPSKPTTTTTTTTATLFNKLLNETVLHKKKVEDVVEERADAQLTTVPPNNSFANATLYFTSSYSSSPSTPILTSLSSHSAIASPLSSSSSSSLLTSPLPTTPAIITYSSFHETIRSFNNCSALFANYTKPQQGLFCNWSWDSFLCWPPTPAGVLARMRCPAGLHGIDTRKYAFRICDLEGRWSGRPNDSYNPVGWTNFSQCYKPEVTNLLQQINHDQDVIYAIAVRTRTMEIIGLILSLCALILSLIIFFNFRTLRNNRTKIHKNLFVAMVVQVIIRLTLYLDQAITRGHEQMASNTSVHGIDNTPYLCEASYVLLEYARTAMFMWMFIEGLYLHNVVTVKVFQGRFPHTVYTVIGWGVPVLMTTVWAVVTANKMEYTENEPCWWNYNLTVYYWILEGPRLLVIMVNFIFLLNIIRVLVVKLRQSQASDVEQARKAVRAAVVLLPLLGVTNLLYIMPPLGRPAWVFGLWAYLTYFLSSFQGFFIATIYCFLNGEVRSALLKSLVVYMSVRGRSDWVPRRTSMFSGAYHTAPETEAHVTIHETKRTDSPPNNKRSNGRTNNERNLQFDGETTPLDLPGHCSSFKSNNNNNNSNHKQYRNGRKTTTGVRNGGGNWILGACFGGQKVLRRPPASSVPPESVIFELSEQ